MDGSTPELLTRRLLRLERRARRQSVCIALLFACLLVTVLAASVGDEVVRARRFEVRDEHDRVRATLGVDETSGAFLSLTDDAGHVRVHLVHDAEQTALYLKDEEETTRVGVAQFAHGGGGVALHGEKSKGAAVLYYKEGGTLRFFDRDGKVALRIPEEESK